MPKSIATPAHFVMLGVLLIAWYCGLSFLPLALGSCFDGVCDFTALELAASFAVPLTFFALPVVLECALFKKSVRAALSDIGLTRFGLRGFAIAALFLLPLLAFFPVFSAVTGVPLSVQPAWPWMLAGVVLNNGLAEETMMRGFVFRHLREGRTFWRAAALTTLFFAGYHLPLIAMAGPVIGVAGVVLAIPTGFVTAWLYERGDQTLWGPSLMHAVHNGLIMIAVLPGAWAQTAPVIYLGVSITLSVTMLLLAARRPAQKLHPAT